MERIPREFGWKSKARIPNNFDRMGELPPLDEVDWMSDAKIRHQNQWYHQPCDHNLEIRLERGWRSIDKRVFLCRTVRPD